MKIQSNSLLLRLITPLSLLSMATVLTISVSTYFSARETLKQSLYDRLSVSVTLKEEELNHWFQSQRNDILLLARLPEIQRQTEILLSPSTAAQPSEESTESEAVELKQIAKRELASYLRDILAFKPVLAEVSILAADNVVLLSTNKQLENTRQPLGDTVTYFADASVNVTPIIYPRVTTGTSAITFATPILDDAKNSIGVLVVTLDLQDVTSLLQERTGLGKTGTTYLVSQLDQQNMLIAAGKSEESTADVSSFAIDAAIAGESGTGLYQNYAGEPVIGVYRWLEDQSLALLAEINQREAFAPARGLARNILLIGFGATGLLLSGIYLLSRRITQPITEITKAAIQLQNGQLDQSLSISSQDEIGVLAQAFNHMARQLQQSFIILETNNQELEMRVQERTAELENAKESAEAATRTKSAFLANMSHELRTPLNSIIGYGEMLEEDVELLGEPGLVTDLHKIQASGKHLLALIDSVLELSKIEAGRMDLQIESVNIAALVQDVLTTIRPMAENRANSIVFNNLGDVDSMETDFNKLRQCLLSLLDNANKSTEQGQIAVTIQTSQYQDESYFEFVVEDQGPTLAPDQLAHIFDAFTQADPSSTRRYDGTGLGLALTRELVYMLGGIVTAQNAPEQGTVLTIRIPETAPSVQRELNEAKA